MARRINIRNELFETYSEFIKKLHISPNNLYNVDEIGLRIVTKTPKLVISKRLKYINCINTGEEQ